MSTEEGFLSRLRNHLTITIDWSHYNKSKSVRNEGKIPHHLTPPPRRRNKLRKPRPAHLQPRLERPRANILASTASSESTTAAPPRFDACLAIQQEDSTFDAIVVTTLSHFPFYDHEELLQMSMTELIEVVNAFNDRLPVNARIRLQSNFSESTVRSLVEYLVGIKPFGRLGEDDDANNGSSRGPLTVKDSPPTHDQWGEVGVRRWNEGPLSRVTSRARHPRTRRVVSPWLVQRPRYLEPLDEENEDELEVQSMKEIPSDERPSKLFPLFRRKCAV